LSHNDIKFGGFLLWLSFATTAGSIVNDNSMNESICLFWTLRIGYIVIFFFFSEEIVWTVRFDYIVFF